MLLKILTILLRLDTLINETELQKVKAPYGKGGFCNYEKFYFKEEIITSCQRKLKVRFLRLMFTEYRLTA